MTLNEYFDSGEYKDFLLVEDEVYILPAGYKLSVNEQEKSNIVSMANGHKRKDIIRKWDKYSFSYDTMLEADLIKIKEIVKNLSNADNSILYLKKENPVSNKDYDVVILDSIISSLKTKYIFRGNLFISNGITLELE